VPAQAPYSRHAILKIRGVSQPVGSPEFVESAVIAQLDRQAAETRGLFKHLGLYMAGVVPGGPTARGGIQSKYQPSHLGRRLHNGRGCHLAQKRVDL